MRKGEALAAGRSAGSRLFCGRLKQSAGRGRIEQSALKYVALGVEAWAGTGADKEQVSRERASQNGAADAADGAAAGGQETDVASDSADSKTKASSGDGTKMDDLTGTIVMMSVQNVLNVRRNRQ